MLVKFLSATETEAGKLPAGTIVDHPDCFLLADLGLAVEHDEEAAAKLKEWRAAKPSPGQEDQRYLSWRFAGTATPTIFTRPDGKQVVVSNGPHGVRTVTEVPEPVDA